MALLEPGEVHTAVSTRTSADYLVLLVEPGTVDKLLPRDATRGIHFKLAQQDDPLLKDVLLMIGGLLSENAVDRLHVEGQLLRLFGSTLEDDALRECQSRVRNKRVAYLVRDYLCDNCERKVTLQECIHATKVGLSARRLHKLFVDEFGVPPHHYVNCVRMARARAFLRAGVQPAEMPTRLGYYDQAHFTKAFSAHIGMSPVEFTRLGRIL